MSRKIKLLRLEIRKCDDCPYLSYAAAYCNRAKNIIIDANTIPIWCPLPNKHNSKAKRGAYERRE